MPPNMLTHSLPPPTVADLSVGESAFVPPAALFVTPERACRIQTDILVRHAQSTQASMQVTRTARGYIADVTYCDYRWELSAETAEGVPHAPVLHVAYGDEFLQ